MSRTRQYALFHSVQLIGGSGWRLASICRCSASTSASSPSLSAKAMRLVLFSQTPQPQEKSQQRRSSVELVCSRTRQKADTAAARIAAARGEEQISISNATIVCQGRSQGEGEGGPASPPKIRGSQKYIRGDPCDLGSVAKNSGMPCSKFQVSSCSTFLAKSCWFEDGDRRTQISPLKFTNWLCNASLRIFP